MSDQERCIIGIDVSKETLDIYVSNKKQSSKIKNTKQSIEHFLSEVGDLYHCVIFYEATWIYMTLLNELCNNYWVTHYQLHPNTSQKLAQGMSDRNKNDEIDAIKIANMGELLLKQMEADGKVKITTPVSNTVSKFKTIISFIHSLRQDIQRFKHHKESIINNTFAEKGMSLYYDQEIKRFENKILLRYKKLWNLIIEWWYEEKFKNLQTIPSISNVGAYELLVFFLEVEAKWFNSQDRSKLKAYVWIDPTQKQSGTSVNSKRISKQGKKHLRGVLFMLSLGWFNLIKYDKYESTHLGQFFIRMRDKFSSSTKKRWKSVCTAMSKKILLTARWIYWNNTPYNWV